jgi:ribosomal 50S subunit-recycling heat shock protein
MDWNKFSHQFDESWHNIIKPFIESEECDKIYAFLKKESARGKKIAPNSSDVFRCFKETKLSDLKVGDIIEIKYLEKSEKFKILQIPTTKSTPKSKIDEYVQRLN